MSNSGGLSLNGHEAAGRSLPLAALPLLAGLAPAAMLDIVLPWIVLLFVLFAHAVLLVILVHVVSLSPFVTVFTLRILVGPIYVLIVSLCQFILQDSALCGAVHFAVVSQLFGPQVINHLVVLGQRSPCVFRVCFPEGHLVGILRSKGHITAPIADEIHVLLYLADHIPDLLVPVDHLDLLLQRSQGGHGGKGQFRERDRMGMQC
mmetsp:Transcript_69520/g.115875  ORF Transcript_69520/g.115875 Transcript_69520/m.115875 type:complete len:205 (+) Transcript_69520:188-802(+)